MPPVPSSSSKKKKGWSYEQLLKHLQIIADLSPPLPALPPSPPASRSVSPAPGSKRKSSSSDSDHVKRPRTSSVPERHRHHNQPQHSHSTQHNTPLHTRPLPQQVSAHAEVAEDGEVDEKPRFPARSASIAPPPPPPVASAAPLPPPPPSASAPPPPLATPGLSGVPVRRPKKGKLSDKVFNELHTKYHDHGRQLKYSGDSRFWSTYPPSHREFRPLLDPPPPGSSYHKHGGLIARLELVDALVCFAYSIWNRDYGQRTCFKDTWKTIEAFLGWCKKKWHAEDGINDAEKAFLGLIWMIEGFIHGRKVLYTVRGHLDQSMDAVYKSAREKVHDAAAAALNVDDNGLSAVNAALLSAKSQATPPMLPSPASIVAPNSANSTPTPRDNDTPNPTARSGSTSANRAAPPGTKPTPLLVPSQMLPKNLQSLVTASGCITIPEPVMKSMAAVTEPIGPTLAQDMKDVAAGINAAAYCMTTSQTTLNLSVMARHFPVTFARMIHSSLSPTEEYEPDFEDEEGELFWPGQLATGEGLGWVCLMGKAMIIEFGKAYGYTGLTNAIKKPNTKNEVAPSEDRGGQEQRSMSLWANSQAHGPQPRPTALTQR